MSQRPRTLTAPVGPGQKNLFLDVALIQRLLNQLIDLGYLVPLAKLDETGKFSDSLLTAIRLVELKYFHGMALPKGFIEPGDSFENFLRDVADHCGSLGSRLSTEIYGLAAVMVPGGADKRTRHGTEPGNIRTYLGDILSALRAKQLADTVMLMMSCGTIRAETAAFLPVDEGISRYNTSPAKTKNRHNFDLYDDRSNLGNTGDPDGANYKGRGFVQLTGRANYRRIGDQIGYDLENNPDDADRPEIASTVLAQFLKNKEQAIRDAIEKNNLAGARRLVNGGSHGVSEFIAAINAGRQYLHMNIAAPAARKAVKQHAIKR